MKYWSQREILKFYHLLIHHEFDIFLFHFNPSRYWNFSVSTVRIYNRKRSAIDKTRHQQRCRQSISCGRSDALARSVQSFKSTAEENQRSQVGGEDFKTTGTNANNFDTWRYQGYVHANKSNIASHKYQSMGSIWSRKSEYRVVDDWCDYHGYYHKKTIQIGLNFERSL